MMTLYRPNKTKILLAITLATLPLTAFSQPHREKHFDANVPFNMEDLPAGHFRSKMEALPEKHKQKALKWMHSFSFTEHDLKYMHVDNEGGIFYSDTFLPEQGSAPTSSAVAQPLAITAVEAFTLHSKPGATNVVYLDFDGQAISNTAWNASSGIATLNAKAYDTDGNLAAFSATELGQIAEIWHRIAEDYAPFNVDVTTELPASFGPTVGRILITQNVDANGNNMPAFGAGGVAYVNVWGFSNYASYYSPALVYANALGSGFPPYVAEAASHEMGHNLGLSHDGFNDGTTILDYYTGHGTGFVSWAPIMGVGYYTNITQWSSGEYQFATQPQDDINLISAKLTFRPDDHGNDILAPTPLSVDAAGAITASNPETDPHNLSASNKGVIETRNDVDYFSFDAAAGPISINVTPAWEAFYRASLRGANLDIQATLYDQNGVQVAQNDPLTETDAVISATVSAGRYYLAISGVGNTVTPYSDYGSLGQYFISGTIIPGTISDITPPNPNPMTWAVTPNAGTSTNSITMQASVASDDSGSAVQYNFVCVAGGAGCLESGWQASNLFTATGLQAGTAYSYQVKARDIFGNQTSPSVTVAATTATPPDTTAPTPNPMTWSVVPSAGGSSSSISMTAITATDASGGIQYHFVCTAGGAGCVDAPWQASSTYTATGLQAGTSYSYQVQARDALGNVTGFAAIKSAATAATLPAAPTSLIGTKTGSTVKLNWGAVTGATSYEIFRCTVKNAVCTYGTAAFRTTTTNTYSYNSNSTVYGYKIRAANTAGKSTFSNEVRL